MAECNNSGQKYLQTALTSACQVTLLFPPTLLYMHVIVSSWVRISTHNCQSLNYKRQDQ